MKIIYISDIHEAYTQLARLFQITGADVYIVGGDLLYNAFYSRKDAWRFVELQQFALAWRNGYRVEGPRENVAWAVLEDPLASNDRKKLARELLDMVVRARRCMLKKYERLAKIFDASGKPRIITIPGNYDMDLSTTALAPWDLHKKSLSINGIKIAAYGGAKVFTPGIPETLQVRYNEFHDGEKLRSEPYDFFSEASPDIILVHQPPYGYLDTLQTYGSVGSLGLRDYVDQNDVGFVLSGHMHHSWGAISKDGTVFMNPSSFGRFVEISRVRKGGYFIEFIVTNKQFAGGNLRQIEGGEIWDIENYFLINGKFRPTVIDLKRYRYLSGKREQKRNIDAIRTFNRLRVFFQKYETQATQKKIQELIKLIGSLIAEGHEIAFHLLGSLNFGMAEETSDVDVVVYFKDPSLHVPDDVACPIPIAVQNRIDALKEHGLHFSICDCLNIASIEEAIEQGDVDSLVLQRFVFYLSTCRCVNDKVIKRLEDLLLHRQNLALLVEQELEHYFRMMISSFRFCYSFRKYQMRLKEKGMKVPPYIEELIWKYLSHRTRKGKRLR